MKKEKLREIILDIVERLKTLYPKIKVEDEHAFMTGGEPIICIDATLANPADVLEMMMEFIEVIPPGIIFFQKLHTLKVTLNFGYDKEIPSVEFEVAMHTFDMQIGEQFHFQLIDGIYSLPAGHIKGNGYILVENLKDFIFGNLLNNQLVLTKQKDGANEK